MIKARLPDLAIRTVQEIGWIGLKNGPLLRLAEEQFEVFVTADRSPEIESVKRCQEQFFLPPPPPSAGNFEYLLSTFTHA
ncbi:MAG: hypothetical protein ACREQA_03115 [Candidatus Binatia bacterium]